MTTWKAVLTLMSVGWACLVVNLVVGGMFWVAAVALAAHISAIAVMVRADRRGEL